MPNFWSMPIGSERDPTRVGELPGPVYRDAAGNSFQVLRETHQDRNALAGSERPQAGNLLMDVLMPMGPWGNLLAAAWDGMTAPKRAMQGEPVTYGETFGTALDAMGGGAFSNAPRGAIRSGAARSADDVAGIRAYHGSPHDFDKFSMDKIGTGEGAQAYGHGLYFAESEGVARSYRDALANRKYMPGDGPSPLKTAWSTVSATPERAAMATDDLVPFVRQAWPDVPDAEIRAAIDEAKAAFAPGRMYEVNIKANPDDFLDWDARLDQQSPNVLRRIGIDPDTMQENWDALRRAKDEIREKYPPKYGMSDDELLRELQTPAPNDPVYARRAAAEDALRGMTGEWVSRPDAPAREVVKAGDQVANAQRLREAGIPGIKYRDQGSRGVDGAKATRNFVVFDDSTIEIIRKYGIAAAAPMLGLTVEELRAQVQEQGL